MLLQTIWQACLSTSAQSDFYSSDQSMLKLSWRIFCWDQCSISSRVKLFCHRWQRLWSYLYRQSQWPYVMKSWCPRLRKKYCWKSVSNHFQWQMHTRLSHYWDQRELDSFQKELSTYLIWIELSLCMLWTQVCLFLDRWYLAGTFSSRFDEERKYGRSCCRQSAVSDSLLILTKLLGLRCLSHLLLARTHK